MALELFETNNFEDYVLICQNELYRVIRPHLAGILSGEGNREGIILAKFDLGHFLTQCSNKIGIMVREVISAYRSDDSIFNGFVDGLFAILGSRRFGLIFGPSWLKFQTSMDLPEGICLKVEKIQKFTYIYCEICVRSGLIDEMLLNIDQNRANQNAALLERYNKSLI